MNIIDAYKLFKNQLVIVVSGMAGCKKTNIAKKLANELNLKYINQFDFYKKDYNTTVKLNYKDGGENKNIDIINWDTDDSIDFKSLNKYVNDNIKQGIVVAGFAFPIDNVEFTIDIHVHIKITKELCIKKRHDYLTKNKDKYINEYKNIGTIIEKTILNKLSYPYYYETLKKSKIDKYIEIKDDANDNIIYDNVWDYIINNIQSYINWFNNNKYHEWKKYNKIPLVNNTNNDKSKNNTDEISNDNSETDILIGDDTNTDIDIDDEFDDKYEDGPILTPDNIEYT